MCYLQSILAAIFSFCLLLQPGTATAQNSDERYQEQDHHSRFYADNGNAKKHYPGRTPNWKNYQRRLYRHFNFRRHGYYWDDYETSRYTVSQGWEMIKKERADKAMQIFHHLADSNPDWGEPKVGYAIAVAQSRQMPDGIRYMRRALRQYPESLNQIQIRGDLYSPVKKVAEGYRSGYRGLDPEDQHFMVASLYYLMGEIDICFEELEKGSAADDRDQSTINLRQIAGYEG